MFKISLSILLISISFNSQATCDFNYWRSYEQDNLYRHDDSKAYIFKTNKKQIDADGAPNAYHPDNIGLDNYLNAGYKPGKKSGWKSVLVPDPINPNQPYVQPSGNFKGYFVSQTTLIDRSKKQINPERYVDATEFPYLVFPKTFYNIKGTGFIGDIGYAINIKNGKKIAFVVADIGPINKPMGEMSIALAEALGGVNVNPRNGKGAPIGEIIYVIFYGSKNQYPWPITIEDQNKAAIELLKPIGGAQAVRKCFAST